MLSNFLVQQVLELFEREATFQGFRVNFFLWAKRGGRVGLINICRYSLHTIGVYCPAKIDNFVIGRKYFSLQPILLRISRTSAFVFAARGVELVAYGETKLAAVAPANLLGLDAVKV